MIQSRERMSLAAAALGDAREDRGAIFGLAVQSHQHCLYMFRKRPREVGPSEKLFRVIIVFRRIASYDSLERDGELIRVERPALSDLFTRQGNLIPGFHKNYSLW